MKFSIRRVLIALSFTTISVLSGCSPQNDQPIGRIANPPDENTQVIVKDTIANTESAPSSSSKGPGSQEMVSELIRAIEQNGGSIEVDETRSGKPVISVQLKLSITAEQVEVRKFTWLKLFPELKELRVTFGRINHQSMEAISELKNLKSICFNFVKIAPGSFSALTLPSLEELDLGMSKFSDDNESIIDKTAIPQSDILSIANMETLTSLTLMNLIVTDDNIDHLTRIRDLRVLDLSNTEVTDRGLEVIERFTDLSELYLSGNSITDRTLEKVGRNKELEVLYLAGTEVTDSGMIFVGQIESLKRFTVGRMVTAEGIRALKRLKQIEELWLIDCYFDEESIQLLSSFPNLKSLSFSTNGLKPHGWQSIARLENLEVLSISGGSDEAVKTLSQLLKLKRFHDEKSTITGAGLGAMKEWRNLETLILYGAPIEDRDLKTVANYPKLKELHLFGTNVTRNGVNSFESLRDDVNVVFVK